MAARLDGLVVELTAKIDGLQSSLKTATSDIERFRRTTNNEVATVEGSLNRLRTTVLSVGAAWAGFRAGREIVDAGMQMQALQNRMLAATGTMAVTANALAYVREESERLGLDFRSTANGFSSFSASALRAGLTLKEVKDIFTGVSEAATALQLSPERVSLVFQALSQMASKGQVTMEELRQQLGESLPGALQIFANAMGKPVDVFIKMIGNGQVLVSDLKKLGQGLHDEFGDRAVDAAQSAQAAFNRFGNALFDMKVQLAQGGFLEAVTNSVRGLTNTLNDPATQQGLSQLATLLGQVTSAAVQAAAAIGSFWGKVNGMIEKGGDAVFGAVFGQEGIDALHKSRGGDAPATKAPAAVSSDYTLGKQSTPGLSTAAQQAANAKERLRNEVRQMSAGLITEGDPNKVDAAKATATLNKRFEEEQDLLDKALKKKAITEQEYRDASLKMDLDYEARKAEIRKQYRDAYLSDEEAFAEGFLGIQLDLQDKSLSEQGASFRESISQAAQHNKAFFLLEKAAALARAVLAARQTVVDAYRFGNSLGGPILGAAFAGVAAAAQAANIAAIASSSYGGGSSDVSSGGGGGVPSGSSNANSIGPSSSKNVYIELKGDDAAIFSKSAVRKLILQINDAISDGSQLKIAVA